jgi:hypothetical protein
MTARNELIFWLASAVGILVLGTVTALAHAWASGR